MPAPFMALTFDDGPHSTGTAAVLRALDDLGCVATFFVLQDRAAESPERLVDIVAAGHEVGLHSDVHERLDRLTTPELRRRLGGAKARLEDAVQRPIRHHRPPYGRVSLRNLRAARDVALDVVLWSHDPRDWHAAEPDAVAARVTRCLAPGAVVLLHDGDDSGQQGTLTSAALRRAFDLAGPAVPPAALIDP